jgi:hypothetical protein
VNKIEPESIRLYLIGIFSKSDCYFTQTWVGDVELVASLRFIMIHTEIELQIKIICCYL